MTKALRVQRTAAGRCVKARVAQRKLPAPVCRDQLISGARGAAIGLSSALVLLSSAGHASAAAKTVQEQQAAVDAQVSGLSDLLEKQRAKIASV